MDERVRHWLREAMYNPVRRGPVPEYAIECVEKSMVIYWQETGLRRIPVVLLHLAIYNAMERLQREGTFIMNVELGSDFVLNPAAPLPFYQEVHRMLELRDHGYARFDHYAWEYVVDNTYPRHSDDSLGLWESFMWRWRLHYALAERFATMIANELLMLQGECLQAMLNCSACVLAGHSCPTSNEAGFFYLCTNLLKNGNIPAYEK